MRHRRDGISMEKTSQVDQPESTSTLKFGVRGWPGGLMYGYEVCSVGWWCPHPTPDLRRLRNYFHQLSGGGAGGVRPYGDLRLQRGCSGVPGGHGRRLNCYARAAMDRRLQGFRHFWCDTDTGLCVGTAKQAARSPLNRVLQRNAIVRTKKSERTL